MENKNILESWYNEAKILSSNLLINKPKISREKVNLIYEKFLLFFGLDYFKMKLRENRPGENISWLYYLLENHKDLRCITALYEIAILIKYSESLDSSIQKNLQREKKKSMQIRASLFELLIFNVLDKYNIPNKKKVSENNQELEGEFTLFEETYLFECKKVFLPNLKDMDVKRRLLTSFAVFTQTLQFPYNMICSITLSRPITDRHYAELEKEIKKYFLEFNEVAKQNPKEIKINYIVENEFGIFRAINYDTATLIEMQSAMETLKKYDIILGITFSENIIEGKGLKGSVSIKSSYGVSESEIYEKLKDVLKRAKKQHKESLYKNKVIFIDNESLADFQMGLFNSEHSFKYDKAKDIYDNLHFNDTIVVIIRRYYSEDRAIINVDTFHPEHLKKASNYIKQMIFRH